MSDPTSPQDPSASRRDHEAAPQPAGQADPEAWSNPYGQAGTDGSRTTAVPDRRPGTVLAAGIITLVLSGLVAVAFAFLTVAVLLAREEVLVEIESLTAAEPGVASASPPAVATGLLVVLVVFLAWSLAACLLAVLALRRRGWARVLLIVSAAVTAVLSLLSILSVLSVVPLLASVAVIVLLLTGGAGPWYAGRRSAR